jgi:hypothetical protein
VTDKEYNTQKKRVQKYIDRWLTTLGLRWFRIDFVWEREHDGDCAARTLSSWQYKDATVTWYLPKIASISDDLLEQTVVHEFTHVLLSGLAQNAIDRDSDYANQLNEYTTEIVSNALSWAREAGRRDKV